MCGGVYSGAVFIGADEPVIAVFAESFSGSHEAEQEMEDGI